MAEESAFPTYKPNPIDDHVRKEMYEKMFGGKKGAEEFRKFAVLQELTDAAVKQGKMTREIVKEILQMKNIDEATKRFFDLLEEIENRERVKLLKSKLDKMIERGFITQQKAKDMLYELKPPSPESEGNVKAAGERLKSVEDQANSIWKHNT